jgi:hypothetical protein
MDKRHEYQSNLGMLVALLVHPLSLSNESKRKQQQQQ